MTKKLKIFDFDGTLYNSPTPNPELWNDHTFKKLMDAPKKGGYGWWQNPITLNKTITPIDLFIESTVTDAITAISDNDTITVLLTGRTENYLPDVKRILEMRDLQFHYYGLKPLNSDITTFNFKAEYIQNILNEHPEITEIELWDDRPKQIKQFETFFNKLNIKYTIHQVSEPDYHLPFDIEADIYDHLISNAGKTKPTVNPLYYGVFLYKLSQETLINSFKYLIPPDWKIYGHHMNMLFGNDTNNEVTDFLNVNMLKNVELIVTHIGISNDAIAVMVNTVAPTNNKIAHITLAVRNGAKPVASNYITDWKPTHLSSVLTGMVDAKYP